MKRLFFKISLISILFVCLSLFAQNSLTAEFPMGGAPQRAPQGPPLNEQLQEFSLPAGPITDSDIAQIKTVIQQVLTKINENEMPNKQNKSDVQPLISGMVVFNDWLNQQECVDEVTIPYVKIFGQNTAEFTESVFLSYPGQIFANILFNTGEESTQRYRLLIYVSAAEGLKFACINKDYGTLQI